MSAPEPEGLERATPADAAAALALWDAAARWMVGRGIDQWRPGQRTLESFRATAAAGSLWVRRSAGAVTGAVVIVYADRVWGPPAGDEGYLHSLVTDRSRPGLGREVLAAAEELVRAAGRRRVRLDCVASNRRLVAYYRAAGYAEAGQRELPPWSPVVLFEKPLPDPG